MYLICTPLLELYPWQWNQQGFLLIDQFDTCLCFYQFQIELSLSYLMHWNSKDVLHLVSKILKFTHHIKCTTILYQFIISLSRFICIFFVYHNQLLIRLENKVLNQLMSRSNTTLTIPQGSPGGQQKYLAQGPWDQEHFLANALWLGIEKAHSYWLYKQKHLILWWARENWQSNAWMPGVLCRASGVFWELVGVFWGPMARAKIE